MKEIDNIKTRFSVIGGDKRSLFAAKKLMSLGYDVTVFGFNHEYTESYGFNTAHTLPDATETATNILLPLPCTFDGEMLYTPLYDGTVTLRNIASQIKANQRIFGGRIPKDLKTQFTDEGIPCFDYITREDFAVLNAIPTAEGALEIAMHELPFTLNGTKCLVLGFGRIAEILAHYLHGLGAHVTASARKYSDLAWMRAFGYNAFPLCELSEQCKDFPIIFNTVPSQIITADIVKNLRSDCLLMDLASKPGGADAKPDKKSPRGLPRGQL